MTNGEAYAREYFAEKKPKSRATYEAAARTIVRVVTGKKSVDIDAFDWLQIDARWLAAFNQELLEMGFKPRSVNLFDAVIRGILGVAYKRGLISLEQYSGVREVKGLPDGGRIERAGVGDAQFRDVWEAAEHDATARGSRDLVILALSYSLGLRTAEILGLDREDFNAEHRVITVRTGRGAGRVGHLSLTSQQVIRDWLREYRGDVPGPLIVQTNDDGGIAGLTRLTSNAVRQILIDRAQEAGVTPFNIEDIHATYVADMNAALQRAQRVRQVPYSGSDR